MPELDEAIGEMTAIGECIIVSPSKGRFTPRPPEIFTTEGEWVERGQVVAEIRTGDRSVPVVSLFTGWMMGMLVVPGQPVAAGAQLFRIRP